MKEFSHQEISNFTGYDVDIRVAGCLLKKVERMRENM